MKKVNRVERNVDMSSEMFDRTYPVTEDKIQYFRENGYVEFDDVLTTDEIEALRVDMGNAMKEKKGFARDLAAGEGESKSSKKDKILQMLNLWENYPVVAKYVKSGLTARIAGALTGSKHIHLFHDQALIKEPGPSAPSPWHQDQPYWPSKESGMLSCWMALDDVTIERGCMQFIPGSHKWGEFDPMSFTGKADALKDILSDNLKAKWKPVPVELKAGSCTFHHGLTFHYANANTTNLIRRALVVIYIPDGVNFAGDEKMEGPLSDTITSRKGEPLRGTKFLELA